MDLKKLVDGLPKTELIYWRDSYIKEFESDVLKVAPDKNKAYLVTKATVFHGKSGGQPSDTGRITAAESGFRLDVRRVMIVDGVVAHYGSVIGGDIRALEAGAKVRGEISWNPRYLAMRRHTAGHLFDHCLEVATGRPSKTVDSWLGEPCYVTYEGETPDKGTMDRAVQLEAERIRKGLSVKVEFVTYQRMLEIAGDAPNVARLPKSDLMRIVTIDGCKPIPCGGTHLKNTSEIGKFEYRNVEKTPDGKSFKVFYEVG